MKVLIADDDAIWNCLLGERLSHAGFKVNAAFNGHEALDQARTGDYDAVLLDVVMPRMDGHAVLRELRASGSRAAVLMVTCKDEEEDKLRAFAGGADDYLVKPVRVPEIVARIRAILRRIGAGIQKRPGVLILHSGSLEMDPLGRIVRKNGKVIHLTKTEFAFLETLMRRPGQIVPGYILNEHLAGSDMAPDAVTIRVHIKNLRRKIGGRTSRSRIRTIRGMGYALAD